MAVTGQHQAADGRPTGTVGRFVLFILLFGLLPLTLITLLGLYALDLEEEHRRESEARRLIGGLEGVARRINPPEFVRQRFTALFQSLSRAGFTAEGVEHCYQQIQRRWQFETEVYCFDQHGVLVTPRRYPLRGRYVASRVWETLTGMVPDPAAQFLKHHKAIYLTLGNKAANFNEVSGAEGVMLEARLPDTDGFWMWRRARPGSRAGMVVVVRRAPSALTAFRQLTRFRRQPRDLLVVQAPDAEPIVRGQAAGRTEIDEAVKHFLLFQSRWTTLQGRLWTQARVGDLLLFAGRYRPELDLGRWRWALVFGAAALFVVVAVFWYRWMVLGRSFYLSIRTKLTLLFLFALVLPVMGIAFLGWRMIRNQEEVLVSQTHRATGEALQGLDLGIENDLPRYLRLFRSLRDSRLLRQLQLSRLHRFYQRLDAIRDVSRIEIRDIGNHVLYTTDTAQTGLKTTFEIFAALCIEKHLQDRLPPKTSDAPTNPRLMGAELFESPEMGFLHIVQRPDRLHAMRFGPNRFWWYWDLYRDPTHPLAFITISQSMEWAIARYLERFLGRKRTFRDTAFRCFARNNLSGEWLPGQPRVPAPVEALAQQVLINRQQISTEIKVRQRRYLATAIPGTMCEDHTLVGLYPRTGIDRELGALGRSVRGGMLITLVIALLIGWILSDTFLAPISDLSAGILALRARDTSYRVAHLQADELGDLARTFNHMMEDVKEMELAKVVQESLIPTTLPPIPGYQADLCNLTASDLGGDYCDIIPLPDGRAMVLIGDVTGHGVSSALLMAMAKAAMFMAIEIETDVVAIITRMNRLIHRLLGRKKLMTFFIGMLDPERHQLTYSNAGHPYPMFCAANGAVRELSLVHYPLGLSTKGRFKSQQLEFAPGDVLVLYTDGIIEATNPAGEMIGYGGFAGLISKFRGRSAREIREALVEACREHSHHGALQDDVTLVVLKRDA